ncbi:facilitated trehalose transporter Tret1-like [Ostrinia furnacalis]|uniref:facilitated trehalose transporter Tret1-like n=1 Tax=Ostrinia furnacalis TaxID=93504 RepID=UPI00103E6671|nr:facilitated trehalose transporter Tret1-like [Ostrinia furnacalis]
MVSGRVYQVAATIASSFGSFAMGLLYVWPSYTTSLLTSNTTTILSAPMTSTEESLVGSLPSLGAMVGTAVVGPLIEIFGRKLGGVAVSLPFVLSWALIAISKTSILILAARFISGIAGGAYLVLGPMFISEVAEDSIRGALSSATITFYGLGALMSYLLGWFFGYNTIIWINLAVGVMCAGLLMSVPESPVFLMKKNREEDARVSMSLYRGVPPTSMVVQEEISKIKQQISPAVELTTINEKAEEAEKEKLTSEDIKDDPPAKVSAIKTLFKSSASRRGFLVVTTVISMQVLMGIVPVQVYAKHVFKQADPSQADLYSVFFAVVMVTGSFVTGAVADKAGRRILLITSSTLVAVCMASLGALLQTKAGPPLVTVAMILMYCFCFMCGAGSIPYVLLAEVFSPEELQSRYVIKLA